MAVIGVRISWLVLARNALLARLASSACSLALWTCSSASLRGVMSSWLTTRRTGERRSPGNRVTRPLNQRFSPGGGSSDADPDADRGADPDAGAAACGAPACGVRP